MGNRGGIDGCWCVTLAVPAANGGFTTWRRAAPCLVPNVAVPGDGIGFCAHTPMSGSVTRIRVGFVIRQLQVD